MKQYAVEVLEKGSHGKYGKDFFFGMYLWGYNKQDAVDAAYTELSEMTIDELCERATDDKMKYYLNASFAIYMHNKEYGEDAPIGIEIAEKLFTCKAYIE